MVFHCCGPDLMVCLPFVTVINTMYDMDWKAMFTIYSYSVSLDYGLAPFQVIADVELIIWLWWIRRAIASENSCLTYISFLRFSAVPD